MLILFLIVFLYDMGTLNRLQRWAILGNQRAGPAYGEFEASIVS